MKEKAWVAGGIGLALLALTALPLGALSKRELQRADSRGGVTVTATYLNPLGNVPGDALLFEVQMNTHSVDLDGYQMEKLSTLRDDRGRTLKPLGWSGPAGGGHHRSGVLKFPARDGEGKPIAGPGTKYIELLIREVAGVPERVLRWDLGPDKP